MKHFLVIAVLATALGGAAGCGKDATASKTKSPVAESGKTPPVPPNNVPAAPVVRP